MTNLWLAFRLSQVHTYQSLPEVVQGHEQITAEEAASWLEASCRAITSPRIVSHHYQLCSVVYIY